MKYEIETTAKFRKGLKTAIRRGLDMALIDAVVERLAAGKPLPAHNCDHTLTGNWNGYRECHIQPDWLLIYYLDDDVLVLTLTRTGSHSDLY